ncbi:MAG: hypothetical protein P8X63_02670 [Desulfuromonadaceae bacterium]
MVGNAFDLDSILDTDLDLVVAQSCFPKKIQKLIGKFCFEHDYVLFNIIQYEQNADLFIILIEVNHKRFFVKLDVCGDIIHEGKFWFLRASELLEKKEKYCDRSGSGVSFYMPNQQGSFSYYLLKKIYKSVKFGIDGDEAALTFLKKNYFASQNQIDAWLDRTFDSKGKAFILNAIGENSVEKFNFHLRGSEDLMDCPQGRFSTLRLREVMRKIKRCIYPTGLVIALLGPDGSGKSTVGEGLVADLSPAFRGLRCFHLRPGFLKAVSGSGTPVQDPHGQSARGGLASMVKALYFLIDYLVGYWLLLRPLKVRSHLLLFDRYYHDLFLDPKRYRYGAPLCWARWVGKMVPEPDLFVVLDASVETIQSRKAEVSADETRRQRERYLDFAEEHPRCVVVRTDQKLEVSISQVRGAVRKVMSNRLLKRRGLND